MKKVLFLVLSGGLVLANGASMHLYDIKSGKITYKISGSANMMGMKMQTSGVKRLVFDNYGAKSLTEIEKVEKRSGMGGNHIDKTHTKSLVDKNSIKVADFNNKTITEIPNVGASMAGGGNIKHKSLAMLKQMGGKKVGTDKILGYSCDVWELMRVKQCIYKGVTLRVVSNVMGVVNKEVATDIAFDVSLSKSDFKLPNFKKNQSVQRQINQGAPANMPSAQEMSQMANALKNMGASMHKNGANSHNTGVQKQLQNALMVAMLPQMKQQILSQEKAVRFAKKCLSDADTLKEAKACEKKINAITRQHGKHIRKWDAATKKQTLSDIDRALVGMECVKKAQSAQAIQQCMR